MFCWVFFLKPYNQFTHPHQGVQRRMVDKKKMRQLIKKYKEMLLLHKKCGKLLKGKVQFKKERLNI